MSDAPAPAAGEVETSVERGARLRAVQAERDVRDRTAAFRELCAGHVDAGAFRQAYAIGIRQLSAEIEAMMPQLVTAVRRCATRGEALIAARSWWRGLRQAQAQKHAVAAASMPELVPLRRGASEQ